MSQRTKRSDTFSYPITTIIEFLLDETASMVSIKDAAIGGFNDFLDEQRRHDGVCLLTLTKFNTTGQRTPYSDLDVTMAPYLTETTFVPNAETNLRDSMLARIAHAEHRFQQWDIAPRVLFVAMTDGEDNASRASTETARSAIVNATSRGWNMVYLGAHARATATASTLGFHDGNIRSFEGAMLRETMRDLARATSAYRATSLAATHSAFFS